MDVYGCLWMFMDVYGCLWMFMDVYGCLWMFMDVYGCLWMFMVIVLIIIYNLILISRYYIVESHGKPTG